ncbi:hypothetical protein [Candidatus Bodocaedibacter vickermanii]|uniref:Secreted protein n=1 Tax=Candidatus Bodocaedibacter vickermanii TaxID=2741701 RepID=A0A7L9RV67_9PROT|nr:hypothetical protein CPBP_01182 [Candidatus Paracaedibacteraceae bacterium 'Lake Konstanz']
MKIILKLMSILVVFTNTNYAVDAVVFCASKGSVSCSLIREVRAFRSIDVKSRGLSMPMLQGSSDTSLDTIETPSAVIPVACEARASLASKPIPILVAQGVFSDDDEEACVPSSLPWHLKNRGVRKASVWGGSSDEASRQTEPDAVVSNEDDILSMSEGAVQVSKEDETLERSESPLSSTCCGLTHTSSFFSCTVQEGGSASDFDDDDFFTSGEFHRVDWLSPLEKRPILALAVFSESPTWIPKEEVTVTFTGNNTAQTVKWGGGVEKQKTVSSLVRINPPRCQTPMTPVNQVVRCSVIAPESRALESRLREASIGTLLPVQLEWNPEIRAEVVKVVPRPNISSIIQGEA